MARCFPATGAQPPEERAEGRRTDLAPRPSECSKPLRARNLGDRCVCQLLGAILAALPDRRLAEPHPDLPETLQVHVVQVGLPLTYIVDRLVHPLTLIVLRSLEDAAPVDVAEQFIARTI